MRAWYKLCHRDMGPVKRLLGPEVAPSQIWQDPVPDCDPAKVISAEQIQKLKGEIGSCGVCIRNMVRTAWASASTWRRTDFRGGANGGRIRLAPQKDWAVNNPAVLGEVLDLYGKIQADFNAANPQQVSMADLIVLGGCVGVEKAASNAGLTVEVPFTPGRMDASESATDAASFAVLEPQHDAFRNYQANPYQLVDKAHMLNLTTPEMTALIGGLRVLNVNASDEKIGVLTENEGILKYDWVKTADPLVYQGKDRATGQDAYKASLVDMTFGANFELRAVVEHYACDDAKLEFAMDFARAFGKVMSNDMY